MVPSKLIIPGVLIQATTVLVCIIITDLHKLSVVIHLSFARIFSFSIYRLVYIIFIGIPNLSICITLTATATCQALNVRNGRVE